MPDHEHISDDDKRLLDALCEEFERELHKNGSRPQIADFESRVQMPLRQQLSDRLHEIELDFLSRHANTLSIFEHDVDHQLRLTAAARAPRGIPSDPSRKTSAIPAEASHETLIVPQISGQNRKLLSNRDGKQPITEHGSSSSGSMDINLIHTISPAYDDLHKYAVEEEIDRGGMGVVLKVRDLRLGRTIALKLILGQEDPESTFRRTVSESMLHRFVREAQITGRLDHPGVVPIHELATDEEDRLYFTMKFVEGETLKSVYRQHWSGSTHWTQSRVVDILIRVCETLAFAHSRDIIHRDLKPSNIMVGKYGEVYVMDWGLAKVLGEAESDLNEFAAKQDGSSSQQTMYGAAIGTPGYMAPEQAAGKIDELDFRTDVYALGTLLYELLSSRRPYSGESQQTGMEVIKKVLAGPPVSIRELNRKATPELSAIADKAMQRDKSARYDSASDLAEELRAFVSHRVVTAYRTGLATRLKKWIARNQSVTIAGMLTLISIIGAMVVLMAMQYSFQNETLRTNVQLEELVKEKDEAIRTAVVAQNESNGISLMSHSRKLREAGNATLAALLALEAVKKYPRPQATETLYAAAAEMVPCIELKGASGSPTDLVWSPDDGNLLTVHADGQGFIWRLGDAHPVAKLVNRQRRPFAAACYSKDGEFIVTAGMDGTLATWDTQTGTRILAMDVGYSRSLTADDISRPDLLDAAFCLNDHSVVTMSYQTIHLIDLNARREIATLPVTESTQEDVSQGGSPFTTMRVSPDGQVLVVGCTDGTVLIWELAERRLVKAFRGHAQAVQSVCFAPDGLSFVTCDLDSNDISLSTTHPARLWATQSGEQLREILPKELSVSCVAFHPNKPCIALGLRDGSICLWNSVTNSASCFSTPQPDDVHHIRFSPEGDKLSTVAGTAGLTSWLVFETKGQLQLTELDRLAGHQRSIVAQEFNAAGLAMASASHDSIRIWQTSLQRPVPTIGNVVHPDAARINAAGDRIFAADSDGTSGRLWSYPELREVAAPEFGGQFKMGDFTSDSLHLVTVTTDGICRLWNVETGVQETSLPCNSQIWTHGCSADRLSLSGPAETTVWNWRSRERLASIPVDEGCRHSLSPSGRILLSETAAGDTKRIVRIDLDSRVATPVEGAEVTTLGAFSANERYVWCMSRSPSAGGPLSPDVKVIDTVSNRVLVTVSGETEGGTTNVRSVAFSSDGSQLLIDYAEHPDCSAILYSIPDGRRLQHLGAPKEAVIGWSPDLMRVVTRSPKWGTRLWDAAQGTVLANIDLTGEAQLADFSTDGSLCAVQLPPGPDATEHSAGSVALWDAANGELIAALPGENRLFFGSAFLPDLSALLTISGQHTLRLWPVNIARDARMYIDRDLTSDEQTMYGVDATRKAVAELSIRQSDWNELNEQIRLLFPVTKERRAKAWSLMEDVTEWLDENPDPGEVEECLVSVDRLITGPYDTDPGLLVMIAGIHEKYGDLKKAAKFMEWAAFHPRADSRAAELARSRRLIAPAVVTDHAADELVDNARIDDQDTGAAENLEKARAWAAKESPHFHSYFTARDLQLNGKSDEAAQVFATLITDELAGPETLLHYAQCELALSHSQQAFDALRANLNHDSLASREVWNLWFQIAFRDLGLTPQQVQANLPAPRNRLTAELSHEQHLRWLLDQLINEKPIRINCGGEKYIAANGDEWGPDAFFKHGHEYFGTRGDAATFSKRIRNTPNAVLYQTERYFNHVRTDIVPGYRIPLPNGTYSVTLGFAEIYQVRRSFDVRVENRVILSEYDPPVSESDWATADLHQVKVSIEDGQFDLYLVSHNNTDPKISCIEISPISDTIAP